MSRMLLRKGAASLVRPGLGTVSVPLATEFSGVILVGIDDAEESAAEKVYLTSADLELGMDNAEGPNIVGLRFRNVQIDPGSPILEAYVGFTAYSSNSFPVSVRIYAEAADNAAVFDDLEDGSGPGSRILTSESVEWEIPAWVSGSSDSTTTTPDISAVINEVISRPGWQRGNSLVVLFYRHEDSALAASNRRDAHSYDSDPNRAPVLLINRSRDEVPEPDPDPDPPDPPAAGFFTLEGNESFDPNAPTLKDGTLITGGAKAAWDGINWLLTNHQSKARTQVNNGNGSIDQLAARDDLYHYGRYLAETTDSWMVMLRTTGDLRILDELVRVTNIMANALDKGVRNPQWPDALLWPTHDYLCWVWRQNDTSKDPGEEGASEPSRAYRGSDNHPMDMARTHELVAHLLYALRVNEGKTSPGGVKLPNGSGSTYGGVADFWENYLTTEWAKAWSGPAEKVGYNQNGSTSYAWTSNYRGNMNSYYRDLVGARPDAGDWPICSRHHYHSHVGASALHYYLGKGISAWSAASPVGLHGITDLAFDWNLFYFTPPDGAIYSGDYGVWPRSMWRVGHDNAGNYPQPTTYLGYIAKDVLNMWLDGVLPDFVTQFAEPCMNSFNHYALRNVPSNAGMRPDLLDETELLGSNRPTAADGFRLDFVSSRGQSGNPSGAPRSIGQLLFSGWGMMMAFDTPDDKYEKHVWGNLTANNWGRMGSSGYYFDGDNPLAKPRVLPPSVGLFLKRLGARNWTP